MLATDSDWTPTDATRLRVGWFGIVYAERLYTRTTFRPVHAGHTPANWRREERWFRRASGTILEDKEAETFVIRQPRTHNELIQDRAARPGRPTPPAHDD